MGARNEAPVLATGNAAFADRANSKENFTLIYDLRSTIDAPTAGSTSPSPLWGEGRGEVRERGKPVTSF